MFYEYHQNNSGGNFRPPAINVIIEASSVFEADSIAQSIGIYFYGVENEMDCPCCGDRWYPTYGDESEFPSHYGIPIDETKNNNNFNMSMYETWAKAANIPLFMIVYKDGRIESQ